MGVLTHGIELACYHNGPGGYLPVIECVCGFRTDRCANWQEAGAEFDAHLAATEAPEDE